MASYLQMNSGGHANDNDFSTNNSTNTVNHIYLLPDANQNEFNKWMREIGSLLHIASANASLKPILDLLLLVIEPERIFLINREAIEGYDTQSNMEIILVIPEACNYTFDEFEPFLKVISMKHQNIVLSLHWAENLEEELKNGHAFYSTCCTEQNLVFSNSKTKLTSTAPDILSELYTKINEQLNAGMERATSFLTSAQERIEARHYKMAGMLLHQVAEQIYKAISLLLGGYVRKTHRLVTLAKIAERYAPVFSNVFENYMLLHLLDGAYTKQADPDFEITDGEINELYEQVMLLQQIAVLVFEARAKSLEYSEN